MSEKKTVTIHITTNMRGFQNWMKQHPHKRTTGFFSVGGRELTHEEVKKVVCYAVEKGYKTDADIQEDEIKQLLPWAKDRNNLKI